MVVQPTVPWDGKAVELCNWTQHIDSVCELTVRTSPSSVEVFCSTLLGENPYQLFLQALLEAINVAKYLANKHHASLGPPDISRNPHWGIYDPVADYVSKYFQLSTSSAKIDESKGWGEIDFLSPEAAANYLRMPASVQRMELMLAYVKSELKKLTHESQPPLWNPRFAQWRDTHARAHYKNERRLIHHLQAKGLDARVADDRLPKKQMARLAGFGNYGKNALLITPQYGPWIRLGAIVTNVEFAYDEPFDKDLCGDCDKCIKACPTGALTPYRVDYSMCLVNPSSDDWARLISGELKYSEKLGKTPGIDSIFDLHSPRFTENSRLMCTTCQRACPYGRRERELEK